MKSHQKIVLDWDTSVNITEFPEPLKVTFNQFYFSQRNKFVKWLDKMLQMLFSQPLIEDFYNREGFASQRVDL